MRLIDADATIKYLREFRCKDCDRRKGVKNGKIRFCYEIGDAPCRACDIGDTIDYFLCEDISPTVDAIPVVRCKDCYYSEHLDSYSVLDKQLYSCCHVSQIGQNEPKMHTGNWFCAYGQLKE